MRTSADTFPVVGGRCTGRNAPVQGQTGPSWQDGADLWILTPTVVRFLDGVESGKKIYLVTMSARCFSIIAQSFLCSDTLSVCPRNS